MRSDQYRKDAPPHGPDRTGGHGRRGRPRSAEADQRILRAVIELIVEGGYDALSIDAVARRSGVAKTTIYRRWPSRSELTVAAMDQVTADLAPVDTGTLRGDLLAVVAYFVDRMQSTTFGPLVQAMQLAVAENPALGDVAASGFLAERRRDVDVIVDRALARGELRPGVDRELVFDLCIGALFMRFLVTRQPIPPGHAERVVDTVLLGYRNLAVD